MADLAASGPPIRTLLDVGCWDGVATAEYAAATGARPFGVEVFDAEANEARARGIDVAVVDLERAPLPHADGSMDLVVVNQVFEHLKNIWGPMAEVHRVLAPGGRLVFSVPNLASLHNRVLLAVGRQPSSIRTFGPHVRGFTFAEVEALVTLGGAFVLEQRRGVGFHPIPARRARRLARIWPGASHTILVVARKTGTGQPGWTGFADPGGDAGHQTHY